MGEGLHSQQLVRADRRAGPVFLVDLDLTEELGMGTGSAESLRARGDAAAYHPAGQDRPDDVVARVQQAGYIEAWYWTRRR